jgi:hypothetical protein
MIVGAHRGADMKIHTSRSMASTINTSHSESLFRLRCGKISNILTAGEGTLAVSGGTLTVDDGTLTAGVDMLAVGSGSNTMTVDDCTLTVSDGTLTSNGQHRLSGAIASMTR